MEKVILIYPSLAFSHASNEMLILPLSLIYVATPLKGRYDIVMIDQRIDRSWRKTLKQALKTGTTVCVGISTMTGPQIAGALAAATVVKQVAPDVPVVWGGVHPSLTAAQTILDDRVDLIVVGDGEETFRELVEVIRDVGDKRTVKGIVFKENGAVVRTPPRKQFPIGTIDLPAYDLIDVGKYRITSMWGTGNSLPILTSRGCPRQCGYCYNTRFCDRHWTSMSAEHVVSTIDRLLTRYGMSDIFLLDDNFFVSINRVRRICDLLIENDLRVNIYNANCRVDTIVKMEVTDLQRMKQAGFKQLMIGVESGSDAILSRIEKEITVRQVLIANRKMKAAGIRPVYSFMAGFPFESIDDIKATLKLMNRLAVENPDAFVYKLQLFTPFPGTKLYDDAAARRVTFPRCLDAWIDYHYSRVNYAGFGVEQVKFLQQMHFYTMFFNRDVLGRYNPISHLYASMLACRIRHGNYRHMVELMPIGLLHKLRNRILTRNRGS